MKKAILILSLLVAPIFGTSVMAQIKVKGKGTTSAILPKKECDAWVWGSGITITGNNIKTVTVVKKDFEFSDYSFTFERTGGKAKATVSVFIDGLKHDEWVFERGITKGTNTIPLNNVKGHEVVLKVKNHSATDRIIGRWDLTTKTNSMLQLSDKMVLLSNETKTKKIANSYDMVLKKPCNGKGTVEIARLSGKSSAQIVITEGNTTTVLKSVIMAAGENSVRINLNNLNNSAKLTITSLDSGKYITAKIGAWFN